MVTASFVDAPSQMQKQRRAANPTPCMCGQASQRDPPNCLAEKPDPTGRANDAFPLAWVVCMLPLQATAVARRR
ncbi:uncharacterized protein THITE_2109684 [Thermothielavioides terrestris NRRL 8126]|uniref:Uncharacterized protein n=1 Tax=Thermothielavioides terrestris (strain ATCC 38088 / NRRL 8126) TaxID=578455 RepID=G2QXI8_THETT|nr:uncharacterized protein THITE_2109684 [Thermothielavioides terrestris NRRL 8126]AEO64013.1 hypothetical protein THITE_2109684 [Thermothielavioides terrestris NRRL 8126]